MLLTRFWILVLTLVAGIGVASLLLSGRLLEQERFREAESQSLRDHDFVMNVLRIDARARVDEVAQFAELTEVRTLLRQASRSARLDNAQKARASTRMAEFNAQRGDLVGDRVFALAANGAIVAQVGGSAPPEGAGLGEFPVVRAALSGFVRDDIMIYDGLLYVAAARPVIDGGDYLGAILHLKQVSDAYVGLFARHSRGAVVAFVRGNTVLASGGITANTPDAAAIAAVAVTGAADAQYVSDERSSVLDLANARVIVSRVPGSAGNVGVNLVVLRPVAVVGSPWSIVSGATQNDWLSLPWPLIGGICLLVFVLAMLFIALEHQRPLGLLRRSAEALSSGKETRLPAAKFSGGLRVSVAAVNDAIEKLEERANPTRKKGADFDAILGNAPKSGGFFGFQEPNPTLPLGGPQSGPPSASGPKFIEPQVAPLSSMPPQNMRGDFPSVAPLSVIPEAPQHIAQNQPALAPPQVGTFRGPPAPPSPPRFQPPPKAPTSTLMGAPASLPKYDDRGVTAVASPTDDLLSAAGGSMMPGSPDEERAEDPTSIKRLYERYISARRDCGESVEGLSYEKFAQSVERQRQTILSSHDASAVRFLVQIKEGKAKLKATPVR